jgi:hypothetical protein
MNTQAVTVDRLLSLGVVALVAAALTSCDSSGPGPSSGIEGTGAKTETVAIAAVSRGPIQSADGADIKVNDTTWSAAAAKITIDGVGAQVRDLGRGTVVTLQGQRTAQDRALANTIDTTTTLRGPFRGLDPITGHLDVLGQSVFGDGNTVLELEGGSLDSLYAGQVLTISGFLTSGGDIRATRISTAVSAGGLPWVVSGVITASDAARSRFAINGLTVAYSETLLAGLPRGAIDVGHAVVVFGSAMDGAGTLLADKLSPYTEALPPIENGDAGLSGTVYRIETDGAFHVGGQRVVLAPGVALPETLVEGSFVRVVGLISNGELRATQIFMLGSGRFYMLDGRIEAIDVASRTFRLLGTQLFVNEWTRNIRGSLNGFAVGDVISVWVYSNGFVHSFMSPWPNHSTYGIEGSWFSSVSEPTGFTVESVADFPVRVTAATRFFVSYRLGDGDCYGAQPISLAEFWERAKAPRPAGNPSTFQWGLFEGGVLIADEVGFCYP